ncbi:hypothetical protein H2201_006215 [Coniosporium apollinis]|uniref:SRR1-like domain-containing protein n=2 Tax=Coniosporium TaxID=2810619 RepID=A0ABQ9NMS3_9PEZI|nr:hypothetical protein H2199_007911 [Cladosporium sp. JES 115]KAJ9662107.1 hypothetical protein H2201_006215 [Coniosporium apollinis]
MDPQDEARDKPAEAQPSTTMNQEQPAYPSFASSIRNAFPHINVRNQDHRHKWLMFQLLASVGGVVRCEDSAALDIVLYCGETVQPDPDHRTWPEKLEAASALATERAWLAGVTKLMGFREADNGPSRNHSRMIIPTLTSQELEQCAFVLLGFPTTPDMVAIVPTALCNPESPLAIRMRQEEHLIFAPVPPYLAPLAFNVRYLAEAIRLFISAAKQKADFTVPGSEVTLHGWKPYEKLLKLDNLHLNSHERAASDHAPSPQRGERAT